MRYNRPSSVFESGYIEKWYQGQNHSDCLTKCDAEEQVVIESTNDLVDDSAMVILPIVGLGLG